MHNDTNGSATTFICTIPAQTNIGTLQYNITAIDASGNVNATALYSVNIIDRTLPLINNVNTTYLANETKVLVRANVTDDMGIDSVTLYFKAVGGDQWVTRPMLYVEGDIYEFTIPAQRKSGIIYYYVNATDTSGNPVSTLSEQDQFEIEVQGVGPDYTLYYILGIILAVLMAVLVLLVIRKFSRTDSPPIKEDMPPEGGEPSEPVPSTGQEELPDPAEKVDE